MAYTAYSDFPYVIANDKLSRWGIPITPTATRDAEILKHAQLAQALIDSKLIERYSDEIPFTASTLPLTVKLISLHLTIYFMASQQQEIGDTYTDNYKFVLTLLNSIAEGKTPLYSEAEEAALLDHDSTYGFDSNYGEEWDDIEDDLRAFPRSLEKEPPSVYDRTYREED